jgi:CheY-like chemotaxis protein
VMDGLAATRELRSRSQFDSTPIIALTAMEGGRERAQVAGCDDFIMKPIELQILYQKVRWWVVQGRQLSIMNDE